MSLRRELLQRELARLGLHKGAPRGGDSPQAGGQQQPAADRPGAGDEHKPRGD